MIEIRNLSFGYNKSIKVINGLNLKVKDGELLTILGPNGIGKSTVFKCMLGFNQNYTGEIIYNGKELKTLSRKEIAKEVAYVPQHSDVIFSYSVYDTILLGTTNDTNLFSSPKAEQIERVEEALKMLNIEEIKDKDINKISGGEKQLVLIARAIVQKSKVIIMDEPTSSLDFGNQYLVLEAIKSLIDKGYTIVMSTHNPDHALRFSTHILAMLKDKSFLCGNSLEMLNEELIEKIYGKKVKITTIDTEKGPIKACIPILK